MERLDEERYLELSFLFFKIRGRENRMHNLTILVGLIVCMAAGAVTVTTDTLSTSTNPLVRILRPARIRRSARDYDLYPCAGN